MTPNEIITVIYPSMASSENVASYITFATSMTNKTFFGANYQLAIALRACHMYYLAVERKGQTGVTTYEMAGSVSCSTGGLGVIRDNLELTGYGSQLLGMINAGGLHCLTTSEYIHNMLLS